MGIGTDVLDKVSILRSDSTSYHRIDTTTRITPFPRYDTRVPCNLHLFFYLSEQIGDESEAFTQTNG